MTKTTSSKARSLLREKLLKQQQRLKRCESKPSINEMNCSGEKSGDSMGDRMRERVRARGEALLGPKFRWINEQMYTSDSASAQDMFEKDESRFHTYHDGFRAQVSKWPQNPNNVFINFLKHRPSLVVGDFGCGEAALAQAVENKVYSFDLVAANDRVTACDISNVPLDDCVLDVAIFSLSLMGTNWIDFLAEAHRVLKPKGILKIAEVKSRIPVYEKFVESVSELGFRLRKTDDSNKMFVRFDFAKIGTSLIKSAGSRMDKADAKIILKPCLYKKR